MLLWWIADIAGPVWVTSKLKAQPSEGLPLEYDFCRTLLLS
jgi:hypothetical protein